MTAPTAELGTPTQHRCPRPDCRGKKAWRRRQVRLTDQGVTTIREMQTCMGCGLVSTTRNPEAMK